MSPIRKKGRRKRIFLVNRDFQFRYTGAAVVVGTMSTLLTLVIVLYPLYQFEILRIPRFLPLPILLVMGGAAVMNIILVAAMGIFVTHKLAGPMYSMVRQFRRVEHGKWHGRMGLRPDDDMRYLVRNFNAMLGSLHHEAKKDFEAIAEARAALGQNGQPDAASLEAARQRIAALEGRYRSRLALDEEKGKDAD